MKLKRKICFALIVIMMCNLCGSYAFASEKGLKKQLKNYVGTRSGNISVGFENLKTGDKFYLNNNSSRAASVIKVFVMYAAFVKISKGELKLNKKIKLQSREIEKVWGTGILQSKPAGTRMKVSELIELMITYSDNRAANIMVDLLGIDYINEQIVKLGCKDTKLGYYFYISPPKGVSNTISVADLTMFFEKLYKKECINPFLDSEMIEIMKKTVNNSKLVAGVPNGTKVAHKTGAITAHEHDVGMVFSKNADYAISVLCAEAPNGGYSYDTIKNISKIVYDFYNK